MDSLLCGLAANPALPSGLLDRLIEVAAAVADTDAVSGDRASEECASGGHRTSGNSAFDDSAFGDCASDDPASDDCASGDPASDDLTFGDLAFDLARRADLSRAQAVALASRDEGAGVRLAYGGVLTAADVDPTAQPLVALALLDEGRGDPRWARLLAADPVVRHREKLAACPGLPPDVVETLASDPDTEVVAELALWAGPDVAARLGGHPHPGVRRAVACNEATPPAVLAALVTGSGPVPGDPCDDFHASTAYDVVRAALANPATPAEVAVRFADHPSTPLRRALATHPGLPPEAYARLAVDSAPGVRADLAENPAVDGTPLRVLAGDPDPDVRRRVAQHPRVPLDVLPGLAATTRTGGAPLPRIASATAAEVQGLARSPQAVVRMLLARRRDLPAGVRDALADDPDAKVVSAVASHPGLSETRLHVMVDRLGVQVLSGVAVNPDATPALLERVARHRPPVRKALREVARHPRATAPALLSCLTDDRARPLAAGHPALPPAFVVELLSDTDEQVAQAAAANPALPVAVMSRLLGRHTGASRPQR
ncbi:hypothetical protein [Streptomyces brasiliscabiei]|uniref:hypothetical protein n=1 Tax=Streptomyces brasiliscabiei TaxID=2736302 RepID=UPI0038F63846